MNELIDLLTAHSAKARENLAQPRIGVVSSTNSSTGTARVLLQPEGVLTGWLPVLTPWAGPGWGMTCPPSPGDQVLIIPQEGDAQHGLIIGRLYSNSVRPPVIESGELALCHHSGSSLRLLNSGIVVVEGDLHVSGDVYDSHGPLSKLRNDYNSHVHTTGGGQDTSGPLPVD
jgi:phage gp45-like